jgi:hypothetical protein
MVKPEIYDQNMKSGQFQIDSPNQNMKSEQFENLKINWREEGTREAHGSQCTVAGFEGWK